MKNPVNITNAKSLFNEITPMVSRRAQVTSGIAGVGNQFQCAKAGANLSGLPFGGNTKPEVRSDLRTRNQQGG